MKQVGVEVCVDEWYYGRYHIDVAELTIDDVIAKLEKERTNTRFSYLLKICRDHFGDERVKGSHHIFKTPWIGDPRINLQPDGNKAKPYQVDQVTEALKRLQKM